MRTTVTLEDDLFRKLKDEAHERGVSFKAAINEAVRNGLRSERPRSRPFQVKPVSMGRPLVDLTKANQLAGQLEDEEIIRKLNLGK